MFIAFVNTERSCGSDNGATDGVKGFNDCLKFLQSAWKHLSFRFNTSLKIRHCVRFVPGGIERRLIEEIIAQITAFIFWECKNVFVLKTKYFRFQFFAAKTCDSESEAY